MKFIEIDLAALEKLIVEVVAVVLRLAVNDWLPVWM